MAEYSIEIVMPKGNTIWDGYTDIISARLEAVRQITERGKESVYVNIIKHGGPKYGHVYGIVERIDYDEAVWLCKQYHKRGVAPESSTRLYRLNPRTGRLMDYDQYWRYV